MKKIKLDAKRLHLKKTKIANLTDEGMTRIVGGDSEESGDDCRTAPSTTMLCSGSCRGTCVNCPPPPTGGCPTNIGCPSLTSLLLCV